MFKKNQIIIYVIVLMLMTAGYLNYTTNTQEQASVETAMQIEANDDMQLADIGDATLVNSNEVVTDNATNTTNTSENQTVNQVSQQENTTSESKNENNVEETVVETNSKGTSNDYFVKSKLERDSMYSQMIESYENVLNSANSLETQRQSATQEIQKINETKNSIMICENLIKTKGFENNIVFVNGKSISVVSGIGEIKQEEIAQIQNIISREMKAEVENIHISTKLL